MPYMNAEQVHEWIQNWIDEHTAEDNPDYTRYVKTLRIGAVSILQFARDSGLIDQFDYNYGLNPIVQRTHPELGELYYGSHGLLNNATQECFDAFKAGESACLSAYSESQYVNEMDINRQTMSDVEIAYAGGWNSKVKNVEIEEH